MARARTNPTPEPSDEEVIAAGSVAAPTSSDAPTPPPADHGTLDAAIAAELAAPYVDENARTRTPAVEQGEDDEIPPYEDLGVADDETRQADLENSTGVPESTDLERPAAVQEEPIAARPARERPDRRTGFPALVEDVLAMVSLGEIDIDDAKGQIVAAFQTELERLTAPTVGYSPYPTSSQAATSASGNARTL